MQRPSFFKSATRSFWGLALVALFLAELPAAQADIFTPFRRFLTDFKGGKVRPLAKEATRISGMEFPDDGKDIPYFEIPIAKEGGRLQTHILIKVRFKRDQWTLLLDGNPLTPRHEEVGDYEIELPIKTEGETNFMLLAVGPRGEVEQEQRVFETYDWELYQKEKVFPAPAPLRDLRVSGGTGMHFIDEIYSDITTWTYAQINLPELKGSAMWWKEKTTESRTWALGGSVTLAYPLPLSGVFLFPIWEIEGRVMRRNIARPVIKDQTLIIHPGMGIRVGGLSQGGLNQMKSGPTTVLNSFTPRMTLMAWLDLEATLEFPIKKVYLEVTPRFSRSLIIYSFLTDGTNGFIPGGWGANIDVVGTLPNWKKDWFGNVNLSWSGASGGSSQGIIDYSFLLAVGKKF